MPSGDIYLYFRDPPPDSELARANSLGRLTLKRAHVREQRSAIVFELEHLRAFDPKDQDARWISLGATVEDVHKGGQYVFGRIVLEDPSQNPARPNLSQQLSHLEWVWRISDQDLEAFDRAWAESQATSVFSLRLRVHGVVQIGTVAVAVSSANSDQIQFARSEWQELLNKIGYNTPASVQALGGIYSQASWKDAAERLAPAWRDLRGGSARDAMGSCLSEFEALASPPYNADGWRALLPAMPAQKREAVEALFSGLCTYLNKVGHHRSRIDRDAGGDLMEMPADQWEGELTIAAAQPLLTYALRLMEQNKAEAPPRRR